MNNRKTYADKGIQTGFVDSLLDSDPHVFTRISTSCNDQVFDDSQLLESSSSYFFENSDAYTHAEASLNDSRYISDRPAVHIRQAPKYGQLGYGKPQNFISVNHRVVSLPETSPPCRVSQEQVGRLVSMPESLGLLRIHHDYHGHYSGCTDHLNISSASNATSCSKTSGTEQTFLGRGPHTPSPPSSPDSVMIIGNESQVPQAFLRSKSTVDNHQSEEWLPWTGSPPKPIPALHGPLSLPYARCPSGAEGTVIEGEDLAHMIWGLESNGSQTTQAKSHSASARVYNVFPHGVSFSRPLKHTGTAPSHDNILQNLYNQDVIDLSRPEFQAPLVNGPQQSLLLKTYTGPWGDGQLIGHDSLTKKSHIYEFVRRDSPIQLYPSSFRHLQADANSWNAGLGIDLWRDSRGNRTFPPSNYAHISANKDSPLILSHPLESFDTTHIYQTPCNPPIHDIRFLDNHVQCPGLPTPPDTGSPRWSPRFGQSNCTTTSHKTHEHISDIHRHHEANLTLDSASSSHQIQDQLLSAMPNYHTVTADPAGIIGEAFRPRQHRSPNTVNIHPTSERPCDRSQTLSTSKNRVTQGRLCPSVPMPPSPVSPDLRRNFSQQQPRSIPLTRLIQRRLSSVVEEETCSQDDPDKAIKSFPHSSSSSPSYEPDITRTKGNAPKEEQGGQMLSTVATASALSLADRTKHTHEPPYSHRPLSGARDLLEKQQEHPITDQPGPSVNRFGENKEKNTTIQQMGVKPKKNYRKKRFTKKQEATSSSDK